HDPRLEVIAGLGPAEGITEAGTVGRRIPFDEDELGVEAVPLALRCERIEEDLRPRQRIATVIVVTRRRDDAEIRLSFPGHQFTVEEAELAVFTRFRQVHLIRPCCSSE